MGRTRRMCVVVALSVTFAGAAYPQYDAPREYSPLEARYLSIGAMLRDFAPRSGYTGGDSAAISYAVWMPMIGYHQGLLDASFGYTRYTLRGATRSAVFFGATLANEVPLVHEQSASFVLPVLLSLDYTKSEGTGVERDNFNVASIGLGTGAKLRLMSPGTEFTAQAAGVYHFSFEGLNTGNGSSLAVLCEAALVLRTLHVVDGLVVGYRFRHQTWNVADGRLNYRVTTHGPFVGVLL
jgi:hypothetical protein